MPTASCALRPNLNNLLFSPREEGSRFFFVCFLHTSRRYTFDLNIESTYGQPASCRARPVNIDDLQNSKRIDFLGGQRLPVMSYAFCPNLKKCLIFAIGEESRIFFICFLYKSGQTPGRCPPQITGLRVNSVTLRWVGAPNERAPFRVHDAIASFADRCLTRTRIARRPGFGWGFMNTEQLRLSCPGKFYTKKKNVRNLPCHSHSIEEANTTMSGNFMIMVI